jgi:hypothetical protein
MYAPDKSIWWRGSLGLVCDDAIRARRKTSLTVILGPAYSGLEVSAGEDDALRKRFAGAEQR